MKIDHGMKKHEPRGEKKEKISSFLTPSEFSLGLFCSSPRELNVGTLFLVLGRGPTEHFFLPTLRFSP